MQRSVQGGVNRSYTGVRYRRRYFAQVKVFMLAGCEQSGKWVSLVAQRHDLSASPLFRWNELMKDGGMFAVKALNKEVREPGRMLGRKKMEAEILRKRWR